MRVEIGIRFYTMRPVYIPDEEEKTVFRTHFEQPEARKVSDASFDYPNEFRKGGAKASRPKPFKATTKGNSLKEYAERCLTEKGNERRSGRTL